MTLTVLVRVTIVYVLVAALAFGVWRVPDVLAYFEERRDEATALAPNVRPIAPALYLDISREFVSEARDRVDSTYAVVTGPNVAVSNELVLGAVGGLMPYVLLPYRQVAVEEADWLLCYGCDRTEVPRGARTSWEGEGGGLVIFDVRP